MHVNVMTHMDIGRPREKVAAYAADPDHATSWYQNIKSVEWQSPKPLTVGTRIAFVAEFLGRRLSYTYEVKEFAAGRRLVMATSDGPFAMETTYEWSDAPGGGTNMVLRNRGKPSGFSRIVAPAMGAAMRRANRADLARLKAILESDQRG